MGLHIVARMQNKCINIHIEQIDLISKATYNEVQEHAFHQYLLSIGGSVLHLMTMHCSWDDCWD